MECDACRREKAKKDHPDWAFPMDVIPHTCTEREKLTIEESWDYCFEACRSHVGHNSTDEDVRSLLDELIEEDEEYEINEGVYDCMIEYRDNQIE